MPQAVGMDFTSKGALKLPDLFHFLKQNFRNTRTSTEEASKGLC